MRALALAFAAALALHLTADAASAQQPRPDCDAILAEAFADPAPDAQRLESARLCQEVAKLREEVSELERNNRALSVPGAFLLPWSGLITGIAGLLVGVLGFIVNGTLKDREDRKRDQEMFLKLMEGVGAQEKTMQLASTSALLRRYEELERVNRFRPTADMKTIQDLFIAILRDSRVNGIDPDVSKYIADGIVRAFGVQDAGVRRPEPAIPAAQRTPPRASGFSFRDQQFEGARLRKVFWAGVAAEDIDLFEADLTEASLRDSWLKGAVFYGARLHRTVLRRADLRGANFTSADLSRADLRRASLQGAQFDSADLRGARLQGADLSGATGLDKARFDDATAWDEATLWPDDRRPGAGFDLVHHSMA